MWFSEFQPEGLALTQVLVNHEAQQRFQPDHRNLTGTQRQDYEMFFLTEINSSLWTRFFFCGADLWFFCELMDAGTQPKWTWQDQEQQTSDQLCVMFKHEQILCCPVSAVFSSSLFFLLHSSCFYSRIWEALCLLVPAEIRPILFYTKQMGSVCRQLLSQHIYKYQQSSAWMWISRSCSSDPNPELRNHEGAQQKLKSSFSSEHDRYLWTPGFSR